MTTLREAAQQALEALETVELDIEWRAASPTHKMLSKAITALRAALEEPATAPHQRKPLTDEEILSISAECAASHQHDDVHLARAIERAHGIGETK